MSDFLLSARRQFLRARVLGWLACAASAAASAAALAWADRLSVTAFAGLGALLGGASAAFRHPIRASTASQLDPDADLDGLLRTALAVPKDHPLREALWKAARGRKLRFLPVADARPLALLAALSLLWAAWARSETRALSQVLPPAAEAPFPAAGGVAPGGENGRGAPHQAAPEATPARSHPDSAGAGGERRSEETEHGPDSAGGEETGSWVSVPLVPASGLQVSSGRDFGDARAVVERYLRLKAQEQR